MHGSIRELGLTENKILQEAETQEQTSLADLLNEAFADAEDLKPFFMYLAGAFQKSERPSVKKLKQELEKEGIEMEVAGAIAESINSLGLKAATELMLKNFPEVGKMENKSLELAHGTKSRTGNVVEIKTGKPVEIQIKVGTECERLDKILEGLEPHHKNKLVAVLTRLNEYASPSFFDTSHIREIFSQKMKEEDQLVLMEIIKRLSLETAILIISLKKDKPRVLPAILDENRVEDELPDEIEAELPKNSLQFRPGPLKEEIDRVVGEEENPYQAVLRLAGRR